VIMNDESISKVNETITSYFNAHPTVDWIPVKKIMPALIEAGIFTKDEKNGLPMRKVLRRLDDQSALAKIPSVHAERKAEAVYWYFVKEGKTFTSQEDGNTITKKEQKAIDYKNSDQYYLISLCDELVGQEASREHTFDTLVGNLHKRGKGRTKLPLDAYYEDLKLVIELRRDRDPSEELDINEQERVDQVTYYNELKKKAVLKKELRLMEIKYASFDTDAHGALLKNKEQDVTVLSGYLKDFLTT